jgi:hypothetical protein
MLYRKNISLRVYGEGFVGGLMIGLNSIFYALSTHFIPIGIVLEEKSIGLGKFLKLFNLDGPYVNRKPLWDSLKE